MDRLIPKQVVGIQTPRSTLIEQTAMSLAAEVWEQAAIAGIVQKPYKNQKQYIKKNFEKFIPSAVKTLTAMLHGSYPEELKIEIYEALTERADWTPRINGVAISDDLFKGSN